MSQMTKRLHSSSLIDCVTTAPGKLDVSYKITYDAADNGVMDKSLMDFYRVGEVKQVDVDNVVLVPMVPQQSWTIEFDDQSSDSYTIDHTVTMDMDVGSSYRVSFALMAHASFPIINEVSWVRATAKGADVVPSEKDMHWYLNDPGDFELAKHRGSRTVFDIIARSPRVQLTFRNYLTLLGRDGSRTTRALTLTAHADAITTSVRYEG